MVKNAIPLTTCLHHNRFCDAKDTVVHRSFGVGMGGGRFRAGQVANMLHVAMKAGRHSQTTDLKIHLTRSDKILTRYHENFRDRGRRVNPVVFYDVLCKTQSI